MAERVCGERERVEREKRETNERGTRGREGSDRGSFCDDDFRFPLTFWRFRFKKPLVTNNNSRKNTTRGKRARARKSERDRENRQTKKHNSIFLCLPFDSSLLLAAHNLSPPPDASPARGSPRRRRPRRRPRRQRQRQRRRRQHARRVEPRRLLAWPS